MHVTVDITDDATEGFNRRMRVEVPEERIANDVNEQLESLIPTARIPGFRPGKVPINMLARRYGRQARDDAVKKLLYSTFQEALTREGLQLAHGPEITEMNADPGTGLTYTVTLDVYPNIDVPVVETLEIRRPVAEVTEEDVDRMIKTLREQSKIWSKVDRPAAKGDRLMVDFESVVTDKAEENALVETTTPDTASSSEPAALEMMKAEKVTVELGSGTTIDGFDEGLLGANAGEERVLDLRFPDKFYRPDWAGRPVRFTVNVRSVEEGTQPQTDEELVKHFGVRDGTMETFRAETRKDMENKLAFALRAETNKRVVDILLTNNPISDLPKSVVTREANVMSERRRNQFASVGIDLNELDLKPMHFEQQARQQISQNLLFEKLVSAANITVDPGKIRERIEVLASDHQDPKRMVAWYYEDEKRQIPVKMMVLHDQVVDWVLEHAKVTEENISFDALLNPSSNTFTADDANASGEALPQDRQES
uniref:Trigger factor n=1 Tax=Candidatus Kentrum sp. MB TaxID=2138164 RepID=A0A450XY56_9GAMM|nr:MAG: trigger factor [Candidatus Kentron sp. MB]VFK34167.1 MAG: trigger factor [Candidatus Kentron sp. MB]VFK76730.1 MAG: trigger factor [Candidatus Kentron sp. MB]